MTPSTPTTQPCISYLVFPDGNPGRLILASTSPYRAQLLRQLGLPFECLDPGVEERVKSGEAPADRALRLAQDKALAVAQRHPGAIVIGSDQVAACGEQILHKPGDARRQRAQLLSASGQRLSFHTAVCVVDQERRTSLHLDHTQCQVRALDAETIDRYVAAEPAADCAGGFRIEGLGVSLFERVSSEDPSALIGLPLIGLSRILRGCGW